MSTSFYTYFKLSIYILYIKRYRHYNVYMSIQTYLHDIKIEHGISARQFAKTIGTSAAYLSQIAQGKMRCGPKIGFRIASATNGKVTYRQLIDYFDTHPLRG